MRARTGRLRKLISSNAGARAGRVVVEQRALRDRLADGAFDVALRKIVAALDLLVQALEHAARLLAGAARAVDGDVIAALLGDHAEPALDQREVLPVLAEQDGGEPVVLEGEHGLRGGSFFRSCGGRDRRIRCAQGFVYAPTAVRCGASASAPNRVLLPISVTVTRASEPMRARGAITCTACKYGDLPTSCPGSLPGFSSSTSRRAAGEGGVEGALLRA